MPIFQARDNDNFLGMVDNGVVIYSPLTFRLAFAQSLSAWQENQLPEESESPGKVLVKERQRFAKPDLTSLSIIPTFNCNNRCEYCSMQHIPAHLDPISMDQEQAKRNIELFSRWSDPDSPKEIMIFGGEPLYNPTVTMFIIEYCTAHLDSTVTLFTNGTLIDEPTARFLANHGVKVLVSIDGHEADHNRARPMRDGSGSYRLAIDGYNRVKDKGCTMGISTQIGCHNLSNFSRTVDEMYERFKPDILSIGSSFHPLRQGEKNPFQGHTEHIIPILLNVYYRYKERGITIEHVDRRIRPFVLEEVKGKDCTGCGRKLVALPDGRLGFCEYLAYPGHAYLPGDHFSPLSTDYQKFNRISPLFKEHCLNCPAVSICGGGCFYNALMFSGSVTDLDLINCEQTIYILEWMIERLWENLRVHLQDEPVHIVTQDEKKDILGSNVFF